MPCVITNCNGTVASAICGFAFCKDCGSDGWYLGSSWGCLGSNSLVCTVEPFHYFTISLYGKAIPDLSEILFANLPVAYLAINTHHQ